MGDSGEDAQEPEEQIDGPARLRIAGEQVLEEEPATLSLTHPGQIDTVIVRIVDETPEDPARGRYRQEEEIRKAHRGHDRKSPTPGPSPLIGRERHSGLQEVVL